MSDVDPTLYYFRDGKDFIFVLVYGNGIYMFASGQTVVEQVMKWFKAKIEIGLSEKIDQFFTILIDNEGPVVKLHSIHLIEKIVIPFKMSYCEPDVTQPPAGLGLSSTNDDVPGSCTSYGKRIGALMHLAITDRSDISYGVHFHL